MPDPTPEPIPAAEFALLMARAGIVLSPEEQEEVRAATGHVLAMAARVRTPREVGAEPALTFDALGAQR